MDAHPVLPDSAPRPPHLTKDIMSYWTAEDSKRALISTLIPGGAAAAAFVLLKGDQETKLWWNTLRKPEWAPPEVKCYAFMDILATAPLGYASYLIYKGSNLLNENDTNMALRLYGANIALGVLTVPIVKNRSLSLLWKNMLLFHLTAVGTAYAFYRLNNTAGYWMTPYAIWTGFYALLTYGIHKENKPLEKKF